MSELALCWLCRQSPEREAELSPHRAAVPTPEMLPSARVSAEHPLQSRGTRHGAPSGQGACHSRGSVEARAPSAASACVSSLGSAAQQPAGADF